LLNLCSAPFGNCCGGQKSRKAAQPIKKDVKNDAVNDAKNDVIDGPKNGDVTTNGDDHRDDKKNPFLDDDIEPRGQCYNFFCP